MSPNGPRLSCGRSARGRKELGADKKASQRGNTILPYLSAPDSFKRLLGGSARKRPVATASEAVLAEERIPGLHYPIGEFV